MTFQTVVRRLTFPESWSATLAFSGAWLIVMFAATPLADRVATSLAPEPPSLRAFRSIQRSRLNLAAGIVVAWILGGFAEEALLRAFLLAAVRDEAARFLPQALADEAGISAAAVVAGVIHLYQGRRGALIVGQLSVLFGLLYVLTGDNLWATVVCHGLYDTTAFVRFATGRSKYAHVGEGTP